MHHFKALWLLVSLSIISLARASPKEHIENIRSVSASNWIVGQAVKTTSGTIIGHAASKRSAVSEYLGIPFAQPPLGKLRFAAPQPFKSNGKVIASNFVSSLESCGII
jgi:Carboxylesterase family